MISCSKDPREINIYDIPDEFKIDLHQVPTEFGTQPSIKISTVKPQPCENNHINAVLSKSSNTLNIEIREIIQAVDCILNPLKLSIDLFAILQTNTYNLNISLKDQVFNDGKLTVGDDKFSMTLRSDYGILLGKSEILKIPDHHVWGYVIHPKNVTTLEHSLSEMMRPLYEGPSPLYTGEYGLFYIDSSGDIHFPGVDENQNVEKFLIRSYASKSEIKEIVNTFMTTNPESQVHVTSSFGVIN